jgi:hypothetical protein
MRTRHKALSVGLALAGVGCTSMQTVQLAQVIPQQHPGFVWVYTSNGMVTEVLEPRLDGDTLRGTVADLHDPFVAPVKDIVQVKARERDGARTAVLIGGALFIGGFTVYELAQSGGRPNGVSICTVTAMENGDCLNTAAGRIP